MATYKKLTILTIFFLSISLLLTTLYAYQITQDYHSANYRADYWQEQKTEWVEQYSEDMAYKNGVIQALNTKIAQISIEESEGR